VRKYRKLIVHEPVRGGQEIGIEEGIESRPLQLHPLIEQVIDDPDQRGLVYQEARAVPVRIRVCTPCPLKDFNAPVRRA
jgi:hypothetical protein